jgi:ankyrin repeat protein
MSIPDTANQFMRKLLILAYRNQLTLERLKESYTHVDWDANASYDGWTLLHQFSFNNNLDLIRFLIEIACADPFVKSSFYGSTALHIACANKYIECVCYFIEKGIIPIDILDNDGNTPLHRACCYNFFKIVKYLVNSGADVFIKNKKGLTAKEVSQSPKIIQFLETQENMPLIKIAI